MIIPGTRYRIALIPIESIVITECQVRYPDRLQHYIRLLSDPANAKKHPGFIHLAPYGEHQYTILDGHHRFLAAVMTGRTHVLSIILVEPKG